MFTFAVSFLLYTSLAFAQSGKNSVNTDDICDVRPDLCGHSAKKPKKKPTRQVRRPAKAAKTAATAKCRERGASYSLDQAGLPICKSRKNADTVAQDDSLEDLFNEMSEPKEKVDRKPASGDFAPTSASPRRISFSSYLNANANHPAIGGQMGGKQEAFVPTSRPATISLPGETDGTGQREQPQAPAEAAPASSNQSY